MKPLVFLVFLLSVSCASNPKDEATPDLALSDGELGSVSYGLELTKPYTRREHLGQEPVTAVYKAGRLRKHWLATVREGGVTETEFKEILEKEKFNARHFHEYILWIPRSVAAENLKVFQMVKGERLTPFSVEPMSAADPHLQSAFPIGDSASYPILVRFQRRGRGVPALMVQVDDVGETQFHWSRPNKSSRQ